MIEHLLNWMAAVLQENKISMTVGEISDRMNRELQTAQPRLDVLLSLDQRFRRTGPNTWSLNAGVLPQPLPPSKLPEGGNSLQELIEKAITLRQQAIDSLLEQKSSLQDQVSDIESRLQEIQTLLIGLDYDQSPKRSVRVIKPVVSQSTEAGIEPAQRYRSVWPLPGEQSLLLENLVVILEEIRQQHLNLEALIHWFKGYFGVGNWAKHSILACVIHPGFAKRMRDQVMLTDLGREYLASRETSLVVTAIRRTFWGIEEMLAWLEEQPLTMDQLHTRFNTLGAGWEKTTQIRYRLNWLLAAGLVVQEPDSRPARYTLVRS